MRLIYKGNDNLDIDNINNWTKEDWTNFNIGDFELGDIPLSIFAGASNYNLYPSEDDAFTWTNASGQNGDPRSENRNGLNPSNEIFTINDEKYSLDPENVIKSTNDMSNAFISDLSNTGDYYTNLEQAFSNYSNLGTTNSNFVSDYNNNLKTLYLLRTKWFKTGSLSDKEVKLFNETYHKLFPGVQYNEKLNDVIGSSTISRFLPLFDKDNAAEYEFDGKTYVVNKRGFLEEKQQLESTEEALEKSNNNYSFGSLAMPDKFPWETYLLYIQRILGTTTNDTSINTTSMKIGKHINWANVGNAIKNFTPEALKIGELVATLNTNRKSLKTLLRGTKPYLQQPFLIQSPVFGDFAAMQALYGLAADVRRLASNNATSDASLNLAGRLDAETKAAQLEEKGREADNAQIQKTLEQSVKNANYSNQQRNETANENAKSINTNRAKIAEIKASNIVANKDAISTYLNDHITKLETKEKENKEKEKTVATDQLQDEYSEALQKLNAWWKKQHPEYTGIDVYYNMTTDPVYIRYSTELKRLFKLKSRAIELDNYKLKSEDYTNTFDSILKEILKDGGYIPKFASGGYAQFFTTYLPAPKQQETRTASSSSSSSKKDDGKVTERDIMQYISRINGLDSDMQQMLQMWEGLSEYSALTGMSTMDLATQYGMIISYGNAIRNNKAEFDKAKEEAIKAGALNEEAIAVDGSLFVLTPDAQIHRVTPQLYVLLKNSNPEIQVLTNSLLLLIRRKDTSYSNNNTLLGVVENAIGADEVNKMIKDRFSKIGTNSVTQEEYIPTPVLVGEEIISQELEKERKGERSQLIETFRDILYGPLNGWYKRKTMTEIPDYNNIQAVAQYIWATLPKNAKTKLIIETQDGSQEEAFQLIIQNIIGQTNKKQSTTYNFLAAPTEKTGGSGKKSGSGSAAGDKDVDFNETNIARFLRGLGATERSLTFNSGNYTFIVQDVLVGPLLNVKGSSAYKKYDKIDDALSGQLNGGIVNMSATSIAGKVCNYTNDTILADNSMYMFDYPCIEVHGQIVPMLDADVQEKVKKAKNEIKSKNINLNNIEDIKNNYEEINEIYKKYDLPTAYNKDGILEKGWNRFICLNVYTTERTLKGIDNNIVWSLNPFAKKVDDQTKEKINEINGLKKGEVYETILWLPVLENAYMNAIGTAKKSTGDYTNRKIQEPGIVDSANPISHIDIGL